MQRDSLNRRLKGTATKKACLTLRSMESVKNGHETKLWLFLQKTLYIGKKKKNDKKMHDMTPLNQLKVHPFHEVTGPQ